MNTTASPDTPGARRRRYRRQPEGYVQLTERDLAILRAVHRHRFLRSTHLVALFEGGQGLLRRLADLYHHAYLDRPREQIEYYERAGSKPMVYALGNKGADVLAREGVPRGKVDWTAKNHGIGSLFLEHTLLVADCLVGFEVACRASCQAESGRVRLLSAEELLESAPAETQRKAKPFQWTAPYRYRGEPVTLGIAPDAVFGLHYLDKPEGRNRAYFFLEADRATMPVVRKDLRQTSVFRKMLAYYATWKQETHTRLYGIRGFRVLTVTRSPERIRTLIEANRMLNDGQGLKMFLFTDEATLRKSENVLMIPWRNGQDDEPVRLAP